jgi:hypothetical protein
MYVDLHIKFFLNSQKNKRHEKFSKKFKCLRI